MKEKNINLELNFSHDNYNSMFLISVSFLGLLALNFASYRFQKDFSNINKPSKVIVGFLASIIFLIAALACLTLSDILSLTRNKTLQNNIILNDNNNINYNKNNFDKLVNNTSNKNAFSDFINQAEKINENNNNNNNIFFSESTAKINIILAIINSFFYIILPLLIFYLIEEKNNNEANNSSQEDLYLSNNNNNKNNRHALVQEEENGLFNVDSHEINSVDFYPSEFDYLQILKNYTFYLTAFISLNIVYLILFKASVLNQSNLIELYSFVPEAMRAYSAFNSDFEILLNLNFLLFFIFAKFSLLIYLPYGFGKLIASLIENLQHSQELKKEYNSLNCGFNKNFEVIKQITTQKLMTGKSLSRKEKSILRQCKENQTLLEHKQEVLEEKYSKIKAIIFYVSFPLKFFAVILTVLICFIILISKLMSAYAHMTNSQCGIYCAYFTDKIPSYIGLQDIIIYLLIHTQNIFGMQTAKLIIISLGLLYAYFLVNLIISFKNLGLLDFSNLLKFENIKKFRIPFIKTTEIRSDRILTIVLYFMFFSAAIASLAEILNLIPSISFYFQNYQSCSVSNIDNDQCKYSAFMLFNLKNSVNFSFGMIVILCFDYLATILTAFFAVVLPLKALRNFFNNDEKMNNEAEQEGEYLIC